MIDMSRYKGLTNDGKWIGTDADDSVIFEVHDEHGEVADYKTIALVMRDSDHYGTEDNPDIRLMVDAPLLLEEVKRLRDLHILACDYLQDISDGTLPDSEWPHIHAMIRGEEE